MLEKLFGFNPKVSTVRTEIFAGITTFLTMAYILAVNPNVMSAAGMDKGAVFTATVVISAFATLLMAFYAKLPFALAPGMGLNAFFAYYVCITLGYTWQMALTAVFLEGIIFILLTVTNLREMIVNLLPNTLKNALGAGIGLFIAFIGLQNSGIVVNNDATLVGLGDMTSNPVLLSIIGFVITSVLLIRKVKGALLFGILLTSLIGIPMGVTQMNGVINTPPSIEPILLQFEWSQIFTKDMVIIVFTLLFCDMFDTIGTLVGVTMKAGMQKKDGSIPHLKQAFMVDALATTFGAMLGSSTVTTFVESASGVSEGGRSGLTAFVTAICFLISLFLAPFFLAIPGSATGTVLIMVGLMMMTSILKINFEDFSESIPAFVCIIFMPMAYSIADGIVMGLISYVVLNLLCGKYKKLSVGTCVLAVVFSLKYFI